VAQPESTTSKTANRIIVLFPSVTAHAYHQVCSRRKIKEPSLALPSVFRYFPPAVAKVYIVSFRTHDDRRPSKFIVLADRMKSAIRVAWEHRGADFQSRFDKSTGQAQEMKEGAPRVL
jgi:hypothetical protein